MGPFHTFDILIGYNIILHLEKRAFHNEFHSGNLRGFARYYRQRATCAARYLADRSVARAGTESNADCWSRADVRSHSSPDVLASLIPSTYYPRREDRAAG